jgi:hypothetical protein
MAIGYEPLRWSVTAQNSSEPFTMFLAGLGRSYTTLGDDRAAWGNDRAFRYWSVSASDLRTVMRIVPSTVVAINPKCPECAMTMRHKAASQ